MVSTLALKAIGLSLAIWVVCLFVAMKITRVGGTIVSVLIASFGSFAVAALAGYFVGPIVAMLAGTVVLYVLICKLTDADVFPDAFLMVIVANVLFLFVWWQLLAKAVNI
jgi:hypothetical protein